MASAGLEKKLPQYLLLPVAFCLLLTDSRLLRPMVRGQQFQTQAQQTAAAAAATRYYELRFQSEVDNSTILKSESQQQIFKCQIRLAPSSQQQQQQSEVVGGPKQHRNGNGGDGRLRSSIRPLTIDQLHYPPPSLQSTTTNDSTNLNETSKSAQGGQWAVWPTNVTLSVDWFKDGQPLVEQSQARELVSIINVELRSGSVAASNQKNDKRNKSRIEVKNTSNGNQLKLTSRLKINQLKSSDSGHYKCLARATFLQQMPAASQQQQASAPSQLITSTPTTTTTPVQVNLIEQTLESNSASLSVVTALDSPQRNTTTGDKSVVQHNDALHANNPPPTRANSRGQQHANQESEEDKASSPAKSPPTPNQRSQASQVQTTPTTNDNGTSNGNMRWTNSRLSGSGAATGLGGQLDSSDDEDLARQQQELQLQQQQPSNFISGANGMKPSATANDAAGTSSTSNNEDDDESSPFRWRPLLPSDSGEFSAGTDELSAGDFAGDEQANDISSGGYINNDSLSAAAAGGQNGHLEQQNVRPHNHHNRAHRKGLLSSSSTENQWRGPSNSMARDHHHHQQPIGGGGADKYFDSVDRLAGLAKLVHKIAPELSCYTAAGEHYRGTLAQIADGRHCLSWSEASQHLARSGATITVAEMLIFRAEKLDHIHHNHCRNPTMDPRGPWCFVQYEQDLDLGSTTSLSPSSSTGAILISGGGAANNGSLNESEPMRYIQRHCSVAPCSEYLWLYIVAPPLGLLVLISCLITLLVRYVRRKAQQQQLHHCCTRRSRSFKFGIRKLLLANGGRFAPKKLSSSSTCSHSKNSCGRYLDEDIFEICDDIDWSDSGNQSLSPKSQESLKLSAATTSGADYDSDSQQQQPQRARQSEGGGLTGASSKLLIGGQQQSSLCSANKFGGGKALTQVGPVFATLRCQARNNLKTANNQVQGGTLSRLNKSTSTFIEQRDPVAAMSNGCRQHNNASKGINNSASSNTSSLSPKSGPPLSSSSVTDDTSCNGRQAAGSSPSMANSGHLISCSSTTEDIDESFNCCRGKYTNACDLPLIGAESISIATNQQQPLYEGKFSQVQLASIKRQQANRGLGAEESSAPFRTNADIGAQVALCALKSGASLDLESIFEPTNLKVRNLNHLNILKLIGYSMLHTENEIGLKQTFASCSLIFDMGQLVDLNDWLRQQSKDLLISCEPGGELGIRRNLTCFAKQIALAVDYLHDRGIVYKDLACRNCFLDPTKMLIKLASFNLELANDNQNINVISNNGSLCANDEPLNSMRSMIRPKYLIDYYVIDSRPSDSQLLPLSWIPLESILFNKFNMQTDVWSFGCLLYEFFSLGEVAYFGYSSKQVIDAVRSNLMPPQPLLCPNGIYKLMCKCLSDIPSMRPNVKQIYEQLNLYSGQCSSFLDHHLCSLAGNSTDEQLNCSSRTQIIVSTNFKTNASQNIASQGSMSKTKSYANMRNYVAPAGSRGCELDATNSDRSNGGNFRPEVGKIPLSKSINLASSRLNGQDGYHAMETNHYDEPVVDSR